MEENKLTNENIKNLIYTIRGKQVMLDSDVAMLYQYSTKRINEAVRRNIARFPERFCFRLTEKEVENIMKKTDVMIAKDNWSQIATSSKSENSKHRGKKYLPYAFTEQGIAMLSGLLKNEIAIQVSINIMDAFVEMRKFIVNNSDIFKRMITVEHTLIKHDTKINKILDEMNPKEFEEKLFYDGQIYDAYSLLINIIRKAKDKIINI